MNDEYAQFMREIEVSFAGAIFEWRPRWPTAPTFEDYEHLATGELYQLDPQSLPFAIYCLMRHFSSDTSYGKMTLALEMFIEFLDTDDENSGSIPSASQDERDQILRAARLEQLVLRPRNNLY